MKKNNLTRVAMSNGGKATAKKYGREYMRMIGRKGGKKNKGKKRSI